MPTARNLLQWGRALTSADNPRTRRAGSLPCVKLQWGRALTSADNRALDYFAA